MPLCIENAAINNVLSFLSTARCSLTNQTIISSCLTFYNGEEILQAKEILANCVDEVAKIRRGENKVRANIVDMLETLKNKDDDGTNMPKFLCDGYAKMPPVSGFETISEHMLALITEVSSLREEIKSMKTQLKTNKSTAHGSVMNRAPVSVAHKTVQTDAKASDDQKQQRVTSPTNLLKGPHNQISKSYQ